MEQKHSSLPWKIMKREEKWGWIEDSAKEEVCGLGAFRHSSGYGNEANAQFMVQACNNFE